MRINKNRCNLLPIRYPIINLKRDLPQLLSERLPFLEMPLAGEPLTTQVLILVYLAQIVTREELLYYIQLENPNALIAVIDRLTKDKLLESVAFGEEGTYYVDSRSRKGLRLTRKGYTVVHEWFGLSPEPPKKAKTTKYNLHNYSLGMNVLAAVCNPFLPPIQGFIRFNYLNQAKLWPDATLYLPNRKIYIEQDMHNEPTKELFYKLARYEENVSYDQGRVTVLLSFRTPHLQISPIGPQKRDPRHNPSLLRFAVSTATRADCCCTDNVSLIDTIEYAQANEPDLLPALTELRNDLIDHDLSILTESAFLLSQHCEGMDNYGTSDYYNLEFNSIHEKYAVRARRELTDLILKDIYTNKLLLRWDGFLSAQLSVFSAPTNQASHVLPYIDYQHSCVRHTVENTLSRIMPAIELSSYSAEDHLSARHPLWRDPNMFWQHIYPQNHYKIRNHDVYVENLSYDIGAVIRTTAIFDCIKSCSTCQIMIVGLVSSDDDAQYFIERFKYLKRENRSVGMIFLNIANTFVREDLVNEDSMMGLLNNHTSHNWIQADDLVQFDGKIISLGAYGELIYH